MKACRKDGLTLPQRLGTDVRFAYNCSVQDLPPKCMHWVAVLGNIFLPSVQRTKEEIQTGRTRQFRARICSVAWDPSTSDQKIVVDEQVLVWYENRFYRANQFAAVYAQFDPRERFPCLSAVKDPFLSQAPNQGLVYQDLVDYVARKIADDDWCHIHARRKPSPTKSAPAGSKCSRSSQDTGVIKAPTVDTHSRNGMTTTTSGQTSSGKTGDDATRGISTATNVVGTTAE